MTLDCTNLKPGDLVRLRNRQILVVKQNDGTSMPIFLGHDHGWNYENGSYTDDGDENDRDIIEILPPDSPKFAINGKPQPVQPDPNRPLPSPASATLTIDGVFDGIEHPHAINCNGKRYVPADSPSLYTGTPFTIITHPEKGVVALRYDGIKYTPADAWPDTIKDRAPTKADADPNGDVLWLTEDGEFIRYHYTTGGDLQYGWLHTRDWKPKPTPAHTREEVLRAAREISDAGSSIGGELLAEIITHLETTND